MDYSIARDQNVLPGLTRIELYNPDGTYYFRADLEPRQVRQLQAERKRRGIGFREVVHETFMLGPVTEENRPHPLVLAWREFLSIWEGKRRLQQVPSAQGQEPQTAPVGECPFCGHSLALTLEPVPATPQQHSVHHKREPATGQQTCPVSLTTVEVARALGVSSHTIRQYCRRGIIVAARVGKVWRIKPAAIDRILEEGSRPKTGRPRRRR